MTALQGYPARYTPEMCQETNISQVGLESRGWTSKSCFKSKNNRQYPETGSTTLSVINMAQPCLLLFPQINL